MTAPLQAHLQVASGELLEAVRKMERDQGGPGAYAIFEHDGYVLLLAHGEPARTILQATEEASDG